MSLELLENIVRISLPDESFELPLNSSGIKNLQEKINNLVSSLQKNNFDWKSNNNLLVFETVSASLSVLKLIKKYKKLSVENKKEICFKLVEKFIEEEIKKLNISPELKLLAQTGVDTIIEPLIELSIISFLQKRNALLKLCPCLNTK